MNMNYRKENEILILYLKGNIDAFHVKETSNSIDTVIQNEKDCDLIVSLRMVDDISSSGIKMLVTLMETIKKESKFFILTDINPAVETILRRFQLYDIFTLMSTENDAIEFLTVRRKPLM